MPKPQPAHNKTNFRFYTNREYFDELILGVQAAKTGDRVLLMTMTFDPLEPTIAALCRELDRAAARGVHVTLAIDAHSFLLNVAHLPGPLWPRQNLPKNLKGVYRHKLSMLESINAYPTGQGVILNIPHSRFSLPVSGRSHTKLAIINNRIFLGGCNLSDSDWVDLMISWRSKIMSDRLYELFQNMMQRQHAGQALAWVDRKIPVTPDTDILLDSGARGQSLIFDEALELIDSANSWLVVTGQYFLNSITARHLEKAMKRGVELEMIFTHPTHHGLIGGMGQHISLLRERRRMPKAMFQHALQRNDPMLHAKLIASDAGLMIGSHNYVRAGVILGTSEIALKSSGEQLAREAVQTLRRGLRKTTK